MSLCLCPSNFISFNVCFICILNCILYYYLFANYLFYMYTTQRFELFKRKALYKYLLLYVEMLSRADSIILVIRSYHLMYTDRRLLDQSHHSIESRHTVH